MSSSAVANPFAGPLTDDQRRALAMQMFIGATPDAPATDQTPAAAPAQAPAPLASSPNTSANLYGGQPAPPSGGGETNGNFGAPGLPSMAGAGKNWVAGTAPAAPSPAAPSSGGGTAANLYAAQPLSEGDWKAQGNAPPDQPPASYSRPAWWKQALYGAAAGGANANKPGAASEEIERMQEGIAQRQQQTDTYNRNLPTANQSATDQAYQRYLAGMKTGADITNVNSEISGRLADQVNAPAKTTGTLNAALAKVGMTWDPGTQSAKAIPFDQLPAAQQAQIGGQKSLQELRQAQVDLDTAKAQGDGVAQQQAQERLDIALKDLGVRERGQDVAATKQDTTVRAQANKDAKPYQDVLESASDAESYAALNTAPGDAALLMRYVNAIKPSSGFRLTQTELSLFSHARSTFGDLQALGQKLDNGEMLTPDQKQQMLDVIHIAAAKAQAKLGEIYGAAPAAAGGGGGGNKTPQITRSALAKAAADHGISVAEAQKQLPAGTVVVP